MSNRYPHRCTCGGTIEVPAGAIVGACDSCDEVWIITPKPTA